MKIKFSDITNLANKASLNAIKNEAKGEIPSFNNLATKTALNVVENKIPSVNNLRKQIDYNLKINEIEKKIADHNHDKCIITPESNKLTSEN